MMDIYVKPWTHAGSFCIGLALGYCLAQHKVTKLKKGFVVGGWLIFVLVLFCILFAPYPWNNGVAYTVWEAVLYAATSRTLFAATIAWVILMSTAYQGGFVDSVLSWKGFIPLSRCTYMVYLTHMWFVWLYIGGKRQILDTSVSQGVGEQSRKLLFLKDQISLLYTLTLFSSICTSTTSQLHLALGSF